MGQAVEELLQNWTANMDDMITVRNMTEVDLAVVLEWRNDPRVRNFLFDPDLIKSDGHAAWFDKAHQDLGRHLQLVCQGSDPFGFVQFTVNRFNKVADWGFYVDPKGPIGLVAMLGPVALDYGFNTLGLHRVCGQVLEENTRSMAFHSKLGFTKEGVLRSDHFTDKGYQDVVLFDLMRTEWARSTHGRIVQSHDQAIF